MKKKKSSLYDICTKNNIRISSFITQFITYLVFNKQEIIDSELLLKLKFIVHNNVNDNYLIKFFTGELEKLL